LHILFFNNQYFPFAAAAAAASAAASATEFCWC